MKRDSTNRVRLSCEVLEDRCLPSFLAPMTSSGGGELPAPGDYNGDGYDDLSAVVRNGMIVSLSNGDGTFRAPIALGRAKGTIYHAGQVDWNLDGKLDVLAVGFSNVRYHRPRGEFEGLYTFTQHLNVWLGNGDGTFGSRQTTSLTELGGPSSPIENPTSLWWDFNRDGLYDLAALNSAAGTVSVSLRNADGTFQPAQSYSAGPNGGAITIGDFNGDGWMDLVVVNNVSSNSPTLSVLLNDGIW